VLRDAAAGWDGVVHLAFKHDIAFSGDFKGAGEADRRAVEVIGEALAGSGRPFTIASGTPSIPGHVATERDGHDPDPAAAARGDAQHVRAATAELALSLAARGVRSSVVRLAPTNHGEGDNGFVPALIGTARDKGVSGYVADGANRWSAAHRLDSAHLFRLALEKAPAGSTLHAVAEEGLPVRDLAEVIGRRLGLPVVSVPAADAGAHFGWLAGPLAANRAASSVLTRELLGWEPVQVGLVEDLEQGHYFA
ncbi:3-beta hydroxysteroid dehydrogenase, partial [Streptomyces coelicoflavus]|uniref:3-beta hydroxysteroid dehydrogenase n=1 Tax=Streptomyces coelicoflavus TaxID=285562 RepID=UPI0036872280